MPFSTVIVRLSRVTPGSSTISSKPAVVSHNSEQGTEWARSATGFGEIGCCVFAGREGGVAKVRFIKNVGRNEREHSGWLSRLEWFGVVWSGSVQDPLRARDLIGRSPLEPLRSAFWPRPWGPWNQVNSGAELYSFSRRKLPLCEVWLLRFLA